jgi:hypothetical protein
MVNEWAADMDMRDLRELADHLWLVEEIPVARIVELCEENVIDCYKFVSCWEKLMDEMNFVMSRCEERMEAIPSE